MSPAFNAARTSSRMRGAWRPRHSASQRSRYFRDHLQNRADVLRHAAVPEHERILQFLPCRGGDAIAAEQRVARQESAAADAILGIAGLRGGALDELDTRPEAAGVLPAAAGTAEPFAQQRAGEDDATFGFRKRAGQLHEWGAVSAVLRGIVLTASGLATISVAAAALGLGQMRNRDAGLPAGGTPATTITGAGTAATACPVARMSTDERAEEVRADGEARSFGMSFTHETSSSRARPDDSCEQLARLWPEPSMPGGTRPAAMTAALSRPR